MLTAFLAHAIKPFVVLLMLAVIGIPLSMAARRWLPEGRFKATVLDRGLFERKKWVPLLVIGVFYVLLFAGISLYMNP